MDLNSLFKAKLELQRFADDVDASKGMSTQGTKLSCSTDGSTWTEMTGVRTLPQVGSAPQTIDSTTLADKRTTSIPGLASAESLAFQVKYTPENFAAANKACDNKDKKWKLVYADGLESDFEGSATLAIDSGNTNALVTFTITVVVSDGPTFKEAPKSAASNG